MPWGQLIASGASFASSLASGSSGSDRRLPRRRGKVQLDRFERRQRQLLDQQEQGLFKVRDRITEGHQDAARQLSRVDFAARNRLQEEQQQLQGQLQSRAVSSGSFGGTAVGNQFRGLSDRTQRQMLDVDAVIGRMFTGLAERRGRDLASAEERIANFYGARSLAEQAIWEKRFGLMTTTGTGALGQAPQSSFDFSGLGAALGQIISGDDDEG